VAGIGAAALGGIFLLKKLRDNRSAGLNSMLSPPSTPGKLSQVLDYFTAREERKLTVAEREAQREFQAHENAEDRSFSDKKDDRHSKTELELAKLQVGAPAGGPGLTGTPHDGTADPSSVGNGGPGAKPVVDSAQTQTPGDAPATTPGAELAQTPGPALTQTPVPPLTLEQRVACLEQQASVHNAALQLLTAGAAVNAGTPLAAPIIATKVDDPGEEPMVPTTTPIKKDPPIAPMVELRAGNHGTQPDPMTDPFAGQTTPVVAQKPVVPSPPPPTSTPVVAAPTGWTSAKAQAWSNYQARNNSGWSKDRWSANYDQLARARYQQGDYKTWAPQQQQAWDRYMNGGGGRYGNWENGFDRDKWAANYQQLTVARAARGPHP